MSDSKQDVIQKLKIGEIVIFNGACPIGCLPCDGREVLISDYQELYAVIGTAYDAQQSCTFFKLPDWRSGFATNLLTAYAIKTKEVQK